MTKRCCCFLILLLSVMWLVPVQAFAGQAGFRIYAASDKNAYDVGDTVEVTLWLERTDADEAYRIYNFEDWLVYNKNALEFIECAALADGFRVADALAYNDGFDRLAFRYQLTSPDAEPLLVRPQLAVAGLRFRALQSAQTAFFHDAASVWTQADGSGGIALAAPQTALVIRGAALPSGGGGGGGGSAVVMPEDAKISASAVGGGSISPSGEIKLREGSDRTFVCTPDSGFYLYELLVDGKSVGAPSSYTLADVSGEHSILAVFRRLESVSQCGYDADCPSAVFVDLKPGAWYHQAVDYMLSDGMMNGITADSFAPGMSLNRGMLTTILWRAAGKPSVGTAAPFADVPDTLYCAEAIAWAYGEGAVQGIGGDMFAPAAPVLREQMAAILWRLQGQPQTKGTADGFADADGQSDYAAAALCWAVEKSLLLGDDQNRLRPRDSITRAEAAVLLMRYFAMADRA